ncbi:MAG TPA: UDP-N-acetylmuramoyl-L-alanyl-D-glutamate--2,6-diaminopimelate ligase [Candidatus Paceibacterota bacterium]
MKSFITSLLPERVLLAYHYVVALVSALYYGFPSRGMVIIGVTGTKGKTSTANFIWSVLHSSGIKAGLISTANIKFHEREMLNSFHMTMPGRFTMQGFLYEMKKTGCTHCVVETTSEGIKQFRNKGIVYDIAVFTNLSPEHLGSHGGDFEQYKKTKGKLFSSLLRARHKIIYGKKIEKVIIVNSDDPHGEYFFSFSADKKITYGRGEQAHIRARDIRETIGGVSFTVDEIPYSLHILGAFNVLNALPAIAVASLFDIAAEKVQAGFGALTSIPGRMEILNEGQDFTVIIDYAHEAVSMKAALETARKITSRGGRVIVLLGAEGGGRDKSKRPVMGEIAGENADVVIVSNVDPYDDDPREILEDIARAAETAGKTREADLFLVEDRAGGIKKAIALAKPGDVVLITGKGAEQSMIIKGKRIPWDDRKITRDALKELSR